MVDISQVLLIIVITTLTIILTLIGIQIIYILREVKKSLEKINNMLEDAEMVTKSIAHPIAGLGGVIEGLKTSTKAIETITKLFSRKKKKRPKEEEEE